MSNTYALDKLILKEKKLSDLNPKELVELIHDGKLTAEMFLEVEREYLKRVRSKDD